MQLSPQSEKELNGTEPPRSVILVREQLRRLLAHPLFTNSKRYPVLLAYTVEQALDGNASELKERTIGVEAFGREPSYDVNLDPVVRITAAEVRKRLIQYYYNSDHAGELVIEMPVGSYVPTFRGPSTPPAVSAAESVSSQKIGDGAGSGVGQRDVERRPFSPGVRHWVFMSIASFFAAGPGGAVRHLQLQPGRPDRHQGTGRADAQDRHRRRGGQPERAAADARAPAPRGVAPAGQRSRPARAAAASSSPAGRAGPRATSARRAARTRWKPTGRAPGAAPTG